MRPACISVKRQACLAEAQPGADTAWRLRTSGMVHHPNYDFDDANIAVDSAYWGLLPQRYLT
jgi:hypothetical protein